MCREDRIETKTYEAMRFYVDIVTNHIAGTYEAYLYEKETGIKEFMFAVPIENNKATEFREMVYGNLYQYIPSYIEEYIYD